MKKQSKVKKIFVVLVAVIAAISVVGATFVPLLGLFSGS
jgi:flagellar basal body-associated protein FliL